MQNIKKNEIIIVSSGEYSDYSISCLCIALEDINTDEIRNDYINLHPEQSELAGRYKLKEEMFVNYLLERKLLKDIPCKEWYMGSYSNISEMKVTEGPMLFT